MSPKEFVRRKFRERWSDGQLLIMLTLAERGRMRFAQLVVETGVSETGTWNALSVICDMGCGERIDCAPHSREYQLTAQGKRSLARMLSNDENHHPVNDRTHAA